MSLLLFFGRSGDICRSRALDRERAVAEQAQSECRPSPALPAFAQWQAALGVKP